jgi:hypothetical protein
VFSVGRNLHSEYLQSLSVGIVLSLGISTDTLWWKQECVRAVGTMQEKSLLESFILKLFCFIFSRLNKFRLQNTNVVSLIE